MTDTKDSRGTLTTAADAAAFIERKAEDYANRFGYGVGGMLSFGSQVKMDHYTSLTELAEEIRAVAVTSVMQESFDEWFERAYPLDGGDGIRCAQYHSSSVDELMRASWAAASKQQPGTLPYPTELTEVLYDVLSLMLWHTGPIAHVLRAGGAEIKKRAEDEQAYVLHWLIQLAIQHGPAWREKASDSIKEIQAATQRAVNTVPITANPAVNNERPQIIARAVAAHDRKWPEQLTSGVMFYEGERITKAEFLTEVRA